MKIFRIGTRMFMYMETKPDFVPSVDFPKYITPRVQEWEDLMGTICDPPAEAGPDERWVLMEEVFDLKDQHDKWVGPN